MNETIKAFGKYKKKRKSMRTSTIYGWKAWGSQNPLMSERQNQWSGWFFTLWEEKWGKLFLYNFPEFKCHHQSLEFPYVFNSESIKGSPHILLSKIVRENLEGMHIHRRKKQHQQKVWF